MQKCTSEHVCASGCVVECPICNREVAGSNLGRDYFAARSILSLPSLRGSVTEYQLQPGRQRQVWLIPIADERAGVQVNCEIPCVYMSFFKYALCMCIFVYHCLYFVNYCN